MIFKNTLLEIVKSQKSDISVFDYGVKREILDTIEPISNYAIVLSGIRRCGKSTLLHQFSKKIPLYYYINFEDVRLYNFEVEDFHRLNEVFIEEFGECNWYFFDEIQNVPQWEIFVRSQIDKGKNFVITGSNASLLSKELGTRLTGRHIRYELYPFSYTETLRFKKEKPNLSTYKDYFNMGGFPEYLKNGREQILRELFNDITVRDIVARYNLRQTKSVKALGVYLLSNIGKEFSYTQLRKMLSLGSTNTVISFISYFEESYLLFTIPKFSYSIKKQLINPKKVYSIDNGLTKANTASFSDDFGRMLENQVFQHIRRQYRDIYYFKEKGECDFIIKEKGKITQAIQVCWELDEINKKREFGGLVEALNEFKLSEGIILTYDQEDSMNIDKKKINILPVWKWMAEKFEY